MHSEIIKNLDQNKAHGLDMINIQMIKNCDASICKPLELIFISCLENGKFLTEWKKANVVPAHKKGDKQRVVLNGQYSSWTSIEAGVPQGSILRRLLFFIYINDLYDGLTTNVKLFTADTSLFSIIVHNMNTSVINLDNDLNKIKNWAIQ